MAWASHLKFRPNAIDASHTPLNMAVLDYERALMYIGSKRLHMRAAAV